MENTLSIRIDAVNDDISLIQRKNGLTFGTDALLLASYIGGGFDRALELGAGTGIISLLLLKRGKAAQITALEVQRDFAELTEENARANGLGDRLFAACTDLREYRAEKSFPLVFSNPPYMRCDSGRPNAYDEKNIARHEVKGTIFDFCKCAARSLKHGGSFFAVYRTDRLMDLFSAMRECRIEPKRMTLVLADQNAEPSMVLVEGRLGGSVGLKITPPFILYRDKEHTVTSEDYDLVLATGSFPEKFLTKNKKRKECENGTGKE